MSPAQGQPASSIGVECLERLVARSPADSTEVTWLEVRHGASAGGREPAVHRERLVAIRVREAGRTGLHQTGVADPGELDNALRDALAQARLSPRTPDFPLAPHSQRGGDPPLTDGALFDPEIAELDGARARAWLERLGADAAAARLGWSHGRIAFAHSRGVLRQATFTTARLAVQADRGTAVARAEGTARSLAALARAGVIERAHERLAPDDSAAPTGQVGALVFSPEAAARFLTFFNHQALSAEAIRSGLSPLCGRLGEALFPAFLTLRDDALSPAGLPSPFDFAGWPKQGVTLIERGVFLTPALDFALARELGRAPTRHAVSFDETLATHLALEPGEPGDGWLDDLHDGVWAGAIDPPEAFKDRRGLCFCTVLRGVRRLEEGQLGAPLPDLAWEAPLLDGLARARKVGPAPVSVANGGHLLGATTAPALVLEPATPLYPARG